MAASCGVLGESSKCQARSRAAVGLSWPLSPVSQPCPSSPRAGIPGERQHSPCACALTSSAQSARSPTPSPVPGPRPAASPGSAAGTGSGSGSGSESAAPPAAPGREQAAGDGQSTVQGWGLGSGVFCMAQLPTFNWVQMFSHCSFTERLCTTLKSQAQKTLMAKTAVELLTLSRKERDTLQRGEGHQGLGLGEGEGWHCHRCC